MLTDELEQFLATDRIFHKVYLHHIHVAEVVEGVVWIIDISHAATHACCEVPARLSEDNDTPAGHVFATMVACSFDDSNGSTVSHCKTFSHTTVDIKFAARSAIKTSVASDDVILGDKATVYSGVRRQDADASSAQSFAEVVVGLAFEP